MLRSLNKAWYAPRVRGCTENSTSPRCVTVDAVQGGIDRQAQLPLQAHQERLLHVAPRGRDGHEMRLVSHQQTLVLGTAPRVQRVVQARPAEWR